MIDAKAILKEVKDNRQKLDGCTRHKFPTKPEYRIGEHHTCENCGGQIRIVEIAHYARGYKAAGGNPDEIMEGLIKP